MKDLRLQEYEAIRETVEMYIKGGKNGDPLLMEDVFHKGATIYGWTYPNIYDPRTRKEVAGPISLLYDFVNEVGPADELEGELVRIDVIGTTANVKLELYNWGGYHYTDTLNLLKTNDKWLIVSKVFSEVVQN